MSQFTKDAIIDSFIEMLNAKPFDKIKVKDIAEVCQINRNTFYYYFQDIYALLEAVFEREVNGLLEGNQEPESWQEVLLKSTEFLRENKKAMYHVYNSINRNQLEQYLYRVSDEMLVEFVDSQVQDLNVEEEDKFLLASFYKHALVGMVLNWIDHGMKEDPERVIHKLGALLEGSIRYAFIKK